MKHTALFFLSLVCLTSQAQDRGFRSEGREFYLTYMYPNTGKNVYGGYYMQLYALVSSFEDNQISVSYYLPSGVEDNPTLLEIPAGQTYRIPLDMTRMRADSVGDKAQFIACHITAKRPVSVQYFSTGPGSAASHLSLPVHAWGKDYVVASYNDNPNFITLGELTSGIFTIIAAYDGTVVTITPTAKTAGGHVGVNQGPGSDGTPKPYTISLSRGQCYFVRSGSSILGNDDDISGTIINANNPVAVIAGHESASVGDGGSDAGYQTDVRDLMVEQMIPVEFWDNTGIISIPRRDSQGNITLGIGENYRVHVSNKYTPHNADINGAPYPTMPYTSVELFNRTGPLHFATFDDSSRIQATQYELRSHGTGPPFPAPSMNLLIPISQWRHAYAWSFPMVIAKFRGCDKHYVTVIADADRFNDILVTVDNNNPKPINNALGTDKTWSKGQIYGHPELKAVTYNISPSYGNFGSGVYTAKAPFPFMIYYHGNQAMSNHYLACTGSEMHSNRFFSFASPGGASLFDKDVPNWLTIDIDTLCTGGWKICATDDHENGGIRYVSLLDDPRGYLYAGKNYQHTNVSILAPDDPQRLGEFTLTGNEKSYCFTIGVNDPGKDAYAPVIIYDKAGNYRIIELRAGPRKLTLSPDPFTNPDLFSGSKLGVKVCTTFTVHNHISNPTPYDVKSISLSTPQFSIDAMNPKLPAIIVPGDSLVFDVCFEANDTLLHRDTIHVTGNCLDLRLPLAASTVRPVLVASDIAFGDVLVGKTLCKPVTLKNTGQASFTVQGGTIVQSGSVFSFDPASLSRFPFSIAPGVTETLNVCYAPDTIRNHNAFVTWQTDITPPFSSEQKSSTNLSGQGYQLSGGIDKLSAAKRITIRPNPARDRITVEVELTIASDVSITIYDVLGREIAHQTFLKHPVGIQSFALDLPKLLPGTYSVVIHAGDIREAKQLVIE